MGLLGSISGNKSYGAGLLGNLASSGRNGDTRMAHVTPGEVVVPKEVAALRPDIVAHIAEQIKKMGGNPKGSVVGRGRINPKTGIEEFATEAEVRQAYKSIAGKEPDAAGLAYWMNPTSNFSTSTFQNSVNEYNKNNPSPAASAPSKDAITSAYKDIAGKEPDAEGMAYWSDPKNNFSTETFKNSVLDYYKNNPVVTPPAQDPVDEPIENPYNPPPAQNNNTVDTSAVDKMAEVLAQHRAELAALQEKGLAANESSTGLLNTALNTDSPLMKTAQTYGLQSANKRGLIDSGLSGQNAQAAMIENVQPFVTQDAGAMQAQRLALLNADTTSDLSAQQAAQQSDLTTQQGKITSDLSTQAANQVSNLTNQQGGIASNLSAQQSKQAMDLTALSLTMQNDFATKLQQIGFEQTNANSLATMIGNQTETMMGGIFNLLNNPDIVMGDNVTEWANQYMQASWESAASMFGLNIKVV